MTQFTSRQLSMGVNLMKVAPTKVLDTVFAKKMRQINSIFEWDVKASSETLLANISVSAEASIRSALGRTNVTCTAPRFAEKEFIAAADLENMRSFGGLGPELITERVADEQRDMKNRIDMTREFMAVKALSGQVVDKTGAVMVDYNLPSANKPVLAGAALWTDAAGQPIANIRAWQKLIVQNGGAVSGFHAFCGSSAMNALINNTSARELLQYTAGQQIAETGRIATLAGVNIDEYWGSYKTDAGVVTDLIPANVFCLVGVGPQVAAELFAPVVDLKAAGGVGKGTADMFFSKMWEVEDPSGQWIKVEARPLPVLFQPLCVVWATVVA